MLGHLLMPVQQGHLLICLGVPKADSLLPRFQSLLEPQRCNQTPPQATAAVKDLSA